MRCINVLDLEPGMKLAKNIYINGNPIPFLPTLKELTSSNIEKLKEKNFKNIYIEEPLTDDIIFNEMISKELNDNILKSLTYNKTEKKVEINIEKIVKDAEKLVDEIAKKPNFEPDYFNMMEKNDLDNIDVEKLEDAKLQNYIKHSLNVAILALTMGKRLKFPRDKMINLAVSSLLHDVGKWLNNSTIIELTKNIPGKVLENMPEGENFIKFLHPVLGYFYLNKFPEVNAITKQVIIFSHENQNGTGYPFGLSGQEALKLKDLSKIILICDKFEHYLQKCQNPRMARNLVYLDYTKKEIDLELGKEFLYETPVFPLSSVVLLSNGEEAFIIKNNIGSPDHPIVRTFSGETINLLENKDITISALKMGIELEEKAKTK